VAAYLQRKHGSVVDRPDDNLSNPPPDVTVLNDCETQTFDISIVGMTGETPLNSSH
jgi:hypothetical protein